MDYPQYNSLKKFSATVSHGFGNFNTTGTATTAASSKKLIMMQDIASKIHSKINESTGSLHNGGKDSSIDISLKKVMDFTQRKLNNKNSIGPQDISSLEN